jgi:acetyl esterase/lipase
MLKRVRPEQEYVAMLARLAVLLCFSLQTAATQPAPPTVYRSARFKVKAQLGVPYAMGVLCDPKPCSRGATVVAEPAASGAGYDCSVCQQAEPEGSTPIPSSTGCPSPRLFNLTLDLYSPDGVPASLGPRPVFVAIHEGGYASGTEQGCLLSGLPVDPERPASGPFGGHEGEMTAACRHFAARGFVCITMTYRLTNSQTGGALAPANWSGIASPLNHSWEGGFRPKPQAIYPAVRDTKAAIRWARGHAAELNLAKDHFGAGGWSAGACTTVFLASQREADFTYEMDATTDPTFTSLSPFIGESASIQAGVVWAGNAVVTDTIDAIDAAHGSRYSHSNAPLAMYRGSDDTTMTPWAQTEVQEHFNRSGVLCELFTAPNATHSGLFPTPVVGLKNGVELGFPRQPVLNHSFDWISAAMRLNMLA